MFFFHCNSSCRSSIFLTSRVSEFQILRSIFSSTPSLTSFPPFFFLYCPSRLARYERTNPAHYKQRASKADGLMSYRTTQGTIHSILPELNSPGRTHHFDSSDPQSKHPDRIAKRLNQIIGKKGDGYY